MATRLEKVTVPRGVGAAKVSRSRCQPALSADRCVVMCWRTARLPALPGGRSRRRGCRRASHRRGGDSPPRRVRRCFSDGGRGRSRGGCASPPPSPPPLRSAPGHAAYRMAAAAATATRGRNGRGHLRVRGGNPKTDPGVFFLSISPFTYLDSTDCSEFDGDLATLENFSIYIHLSNSL